MDARVTILNPWDSQGNQITDGAGIYPCLRGCGGAGYQQGYVLQHMEKQEENQLDVRVTGVDVYNFDITGNIACCLTANIGTPSTAGQKIIILNDQGGSVMDISNEVTACLRAQEHGHPPIVCFKERAGKPGGGKGILIGEDKSFTLSTLQDEAICYAVQSHPMSSDIRITEGAVPTITTKMAKGCADGPLVLIDNESICDREPSCRFKDKD